MAKRTTRGDTPTPKNPVPKNIRVDDDLWEAFGQAVAKHDLDRSAAIRQFIRWYVHHPDAMELQRPANPSWPPNE